MIIYKTTNLVNGKIYVGKDASDRLAYLGSGMILRRAITKHGKENFRKEILERCYSLTELAQKEVEWIARLHANDPAIGYNLTEGGNGGDTYSSLDAERKERRRRELTEAARRYVRSEDGRKFLSENSKRVWRQKSHRDLIVKLMTGREIKWADKISASIKEWHKTSCISEQGKQNIAEASRRRRGIELKPLSDELKRYIIQMYQTIGPKLIAERLQQEGHDVSIYLVTNVLKRAGIYQKWKKGIGPKEQRHASIIRCKRVAEHQKIPLDIL